MKKRDFTVFTMLSVFVLIFAADEVFAIEKSDIINKGEIIIYGGLYVESVVSTKVSFDVTAVDNFNESIPVQCDKTSDSIFDVGKTTVRCIAIDSLGNQLRESFVITVGYSIVQIPEWFKQTTEFWISQDMSDEEYIKTLEFLLDEKLMYLPQTKMPKENSELEIPVWINTNAVKWTEGEISNDEFSIGIQWMLDHGIVQS
ncbi:MAG: plastocyanin [Nitrosopumilus sp.]|uniref:plastocyanin n=1 Tax=Nitrosopumilus sp. TaxID=2024843 RepID=UPI0029311C8F|nr:plastocyanin [Nitrosopumilus sp.]